MTLVLPCKSLRTRAFSLVLTSLLAHGCGGAKKKHDAPSDGGMNGATEDAALADAGIDAAVPIGCIENAPRFSTQMSAAGRGFDLAVDGIEVHAAWSVEACPGVGNEATGHALRYVRFETGGEVGEPQELPIVDGSGCAKLRDPVMLLANSGASARIDFISTREGPWETYALDPLSSSPTPKRLSDGTTNYLSRELTGVVVGQKPLLAWIEQEELSADRVVRDGASAPVLVPTSLASKLVSVALGQYGDGKGGRATALLYAANDGTKLRLFMQDLDADFAPKGDARLLSERIDPGVHMDMVARESGAGLVFTEGESVAAQLRYLELGPDGAPLAAPIKLTSGNQVARGPSIASFAGGHVVAFRAVRPDAPMRAVLRILFLDPQGNIAGFRDVLETSASGGAVVMRAGVDGRLVIGFAEVDSDGAQTFHVARVTCNG